MVSSIKKPPGKKSIMENIVHYIIQIKRNLKL